LLSGDYEIANKVESGWNSNLSERGLYFASGKRLNSGQRLELVLKMPEDIVGRENSKWLRVGQVVRTPALVSTSWAWALGVAVEFEPYEPVR
jgi:hypothetical protein